MAISQIAVEDDKVVVPGDITDGNHLYISPDFQNGSGEGLSQNIRMNLDITEFDSGNDGATNITLVIEGKAANGKYAPIAYQFCPHRYWHTDSKTKRQIIMQEHMFWPAAGVDNIVFAGGVTISQVSNQPGVLPETYRFCLIIQDPNDAFVSAKFSLYGERYSNV